MIKMDFTTTAMARPDIVNKTFKSFNRNLKGIKLKNCRLFINIDPLPPDVSRREVAKVCEQYFGEVVAHYPKKPNYTSAYNWVWSSAETEFIFNIEDDWALMREVSVPDLLNYFKEYPNLMEVALRAYAYPYKTCPTSPSIMHKRYYKAVGGNLNESFNPECQLRGKKWGIEMPAPTLNVSYKGKLVVYPRKNNKKEIILKDLGRTWLTKSKYKRPKGKKNFTAWELKKK